MKRKASRYENNFTAGSNYHKSITSGIIIISILWRTTLLANNLKPIKSTIENFLYHQSGNKYDQPIKPLPKAKKLLPEALISEGNLSRLQAVFAKAQNGENITLGVIGGSITRAGAKIAIDKRYANVMLAWWQKTFPKTKFDLINAGIGATRSDYGALRVQRDLLDKSPDLVIVEFAVNDLDTTEYAESFEGLIRKLLNAPQRPAVMLLFMTRKDGSSVQDTEIKIGSHYQLPMISYRNAVWHEMQAGRLKWEQICPDEVHPNESGHALTGNLICQTLNKALKKYKKGESLSIKKISAPLYSDAYEFTSLSDAEMLIPVNNEGWVYDGSGKDSKGWTSSVPGSIIEFEINGPNIYLSFWKVNGAMGKAKVTIDGQTSEVLDGWFDQTWGGYRDMINIGKNVGQGKHLVHIELLADKNENSTGNEFRVLCLGSTGIDHN